MNEVTSTSVYNSGITDDRLILWQRVINVANNWKSKQVSFRKSENRVTRKRESSFLEKVSGWWNEDEKKKGIKNNGYMYDKGQLMLDAKGKKRKGKFVVIHGCKKGDRE